MLEFALRFCRLRGEWIGKEEKKDPMQPSKRCAASGMVCVPGQGLWLVKLRRSALGLCKWHRAIPDELSACVGPGVGCRSGNGADTSRSLVARFLSPLEILKPAVNFSIFNDVDIHLHRLPQTVRGRLVGLTAAANVGRAMILRV
jgi:hypothetical protein